jgi:hypothetical protein
MRISKYLKYIIHVLITFTIISCGENKKSQKSTLNEFELKHGIGPIKEFIVLKNIDLKSANEGNRIFQAKCTSCHKLDMDFVGPALGKIVEQRSPEYIINMIVNPVDMTLYHPVARKQIEKYKSQMTFQNVKLNDAFKILDYLRNANENGI